MDSIKIGTVNGVEITAFQKEDQILVPIKPICTALGVAFEPQFRKIKEDKYLASTITLEVTVGADNSPREMSCLPLFFIPGWLFSINPNNVMPEAKENVMKYRWECYHTLYRHFFGDFIESSSMGSRAREIKKEIESIEESLMQNKTKEKELRTRIAELRAQYQDVTDKMISPERHLFNS